MGNGSVMYGLIEQALLNAHTGFFGKVLSVKDFTAKIQPLQMYKAVDGKAKKHDVIENVPIMHNVRKWGKRTITFKDEDTTDGDTNMSSVVATPQDKSHNHSFNVYEPNMIEAGDIVYCVCADRDISDTKKGKQALPVLGHHSLANAVVVGVVQDKEFIYEKKTTLGKDNTAKEVGKD
jgi:hypothetical protein